MTPLTPDLHVAGQLSPADLADAAARGIRLVVNNRPDGEEDGQPTSGEMRAAAEAAGLAYRYLPVTHAGFSLAQVDAMGAALAEADGPVLAFCRSGTRSTLLWALARARAGDRPDELQATAAAAGFDLSAVRHSLDALAAARN